MTALVPIRAPSFARVNWGRWIADCPACPSAFALDRRQESFECWDCGAPASVVWPPFVADVGRMLLMRPDPTTRNWTPGETVDDLLEENLTHGICPPSWLDGSDMTGITIIDSHVVSAPELIHAGPHPLPVEG